MPSRLLHVEHIFNGGWAPDYGAYAVAAIDKSGRCNIPWLIEAKNYQFEADGTPHKIGGTQKLFSVALESGAAIRGLFDFWKQGTAGCPSQKRVLHVGTKVKMDNGDGSFSDVFSGLMDDSIPNYSSFEGNIIIAQTGTDMPMWSDGVTHTTFSSPTPNFSFSETHKLRQWAAGVDAAPSHVFYSVYEDPTDWTGSGSGNIAVAPGDGDRITALASHRNELFVFKGPHKGSIHRISGSAPTGDDPFTLNEFIPSGLGAAGQRSVFRFGNDLGFVAPDGTVHSLNLTDRYSDFLETALSRPLNSWIRNAVNKEFLPWASTAANDSMGIVRLSAPVYASHTNNLVLMMDYRFDPPRWSTAPALSDYCYCLAQVSKSSFGSDPTTMAGGSDGFVRRLDWHTCAIDHAVTGTFDCSFLTPFLAYTPFSTLGVIYFGGVKISPKSAKNFTFYWARDGQDTQSSTGVQWTGDVLSVVPQASPFVLGSSELIGDRTVSKLFDLIEGGEFRQIQYGVANNGAGADIHVKSILASIKPGSFSAEPNE